MDKIQELRAILDKKAAERKKKRIAALQADYLARINSRLRKRQDDNGDQWITTNNGAHILLSKSGEVKAGMGGKFNGEKISDVPGVGSNPPESIKSNSPPREGRGHKRRSIYDTEVVNETMTERYIKKELGDNATNAQAKLMGEAFQNHWFATDYSDMRAAQMGSSEHKDLLKYTDAMEEYIELSPKWNGGTLYRGLTLNQNQFNELQLAYENNEPINMKGLSSWTSDAKIAKSFAKNTAHKGITQSGMSALCSVKSTKKGTPVSHLSHSYDREVLISGTASFRISNIKSTKFYTHIEMEEIDDE